MILEERTRIGAPPEEVFRYFEEMDSNYEEWHPDHITFRWVEGEGLERGNRSYFEEVIGGTLMKKTVWYAAVEPDRYIELRPTSRLIRFVLPYISFAFEPDGEGCRVVQRIKIRTGPIGARLNRREFDAVRRHMNEEGENLKRILEGGD
ncbi:SRPBCC family protein [Natronorarus salvus]|uniref:SRPBCC family protein n=1 Tax=Natronorarus salvus TaxID=3117733 RepID=UPI002F26B904